ncbi:mechanosensitive ion channel family protein [Mycobacterium sp. shizuoka-1]|uniref:mechanosensitive ion channel family protein n=1 Tax=Mycobacterium sp. shizuoka-1 TaxID=2039281 RepID=UPI000C0653BD|nr:mechanosensitive ion channel domain-containing protein [Mycobacterium sp. shizuoka-1]GAY16039.1 mechanosensitive ion channel protein MscS [Mycobacterium sp. shizuoka-1]
MPEDTDLSSAASFAVMAAWVAGGLIVAYGAGAVLSWTLHRLGRRSDLLADVARLTRRPARAVLMMIAALTAFDRVTDGQAFWRNSVHQVMVILLIAAVTWVVSSLVMVAEQRVIARFGGGDAQMTDADRHRRKIRTQVTVLRRIGVAIVIVIGTAAALMTFPSFVDLGRTLFASAGVLSVVAGLAAQTSLGAAFAGIQIAFSDAIRVGDVVVLEDEWGRIEEITLTYVVVHLWDERRLVLPCTYFTTTPFQNWTRQATELLGTAELDVDFTVPLDGMRAELDRLLSASDLWDGRVGVLQVTDAVGGHLRVRMLVSAANAGALFDLRCTVREGMVRWLQRTNPGALPRWRIEQFREASANLETHDAVTPSHRRADAQLFSGSPQAEQRGRTFEGPGPEAMAERAETPALAEARNDRRSR